MTPDGEVVDGGPDQRVRNAALRMLTTIGVRGKEPTRERPPEKGFYAYELDALMIDAYQRGEIASQSGITALNPNGESVDLGPD